MNRPSPRPKPRAASDELLVLQRAETLAGELLQRTARWPKSQRHTLTRRIEDHLLDIVDGLVIARYEVDGRLHRLDRVNLLLERTRFLVRLARGSRSCPARHYELASRGLDEVGRMLHGWRKRLRGGAS